MMYSKPYYRYWGKVDSSSAITPAWHLLVYHSLDVAAVGWVLLDTGKSLCQRLSRNLQVDPVWLRCWFSFCLLFHDVGKFATAFQSLVRDLSPLLVPSNPRMINSSERHDTLGFLLWRKILRNHFVQCVEFVYTSDTVAQKRILRGIDPWIEIVTGHHGVPPKTLPLHLPNFYTEDDENSAKDFFERAIELFSTNFDLSRFLDKEFNRRLKHNSWMLAGITVIADWIGSGRSSEHFFQDELPLEDYWHGEALPFARRIVEAADFSRATVAPFKGIKHLFPSISTLTPLQQWAEHSVYTDCQQLFILEDVTGSGKTEAALTLAHRLMEKSLAEGIYVALPTMATANAMYTRLGKAYRRLFSKTDRPSLVLSHGARHLSKDFRNSIGLPEGRKPVHTYSTEDEPNETYCSAWLADSRKKALLADVGVGTLDQALLAVLPARHQSLRIVGLANKVLIVDEVHSYDPYMNQLLQTLLEAHSRQGGSAILLSATLPYQVREKYIRSFCEGAGIEMPALIENSDYPLVTHIPSSGNPEIHVDTREEVKRTVTVTMVDDLDSIVKVIEEAVKNGQCVCWIRNTVRDARDAFHHLRGQNWVESKKVMLFHSRFAMIDRQRIEMTTLERFGKTSTAEQRRGRILVATQVVEQSLDLDFDVMISDLAPIELIIQRAGRLHRHVRDTHGNLLDNQTSSKKRTSPVLTIFGPPPSTEPDADWLKATLPGTQAVYKHVGRLWLTYNLLATMKRITMPDDARILIEGVYGEDAQEKIPEALLDYSWTAEGHAISQRGMARLNVLKLARGYSRASAEDSGGWDNEARIPTRLGDESVSVALALCEGETLKPYAQSTEFAWELSMVDVPYYLWEKAAGQIPGTMSSVITKLKDEINVLRWVEVFPIMNDLAAWYSPTMGWGLIEEVTDEPN